MFEDIFNENCVIEEKPRKNFDEADAEVIRKLQNNELNVEEIVRNLEKSYKGKIRKYFAILFVKLIYSDYR